MHLRMGAGQGAALQEAFHVQAQAGGSDLGIRLSSSSHTEDAPWAGWIRISLRDDYIFLIGAVEVQDCLGVVRTAIASCPLMRRVSLRDKPKFFKGKGESLCETSLVSGRSRGRMSVFLCAAAFDGDFVSEPLCLQEYSCLDLYLYRLLHLHIYLADINAFGRV